MSLIICVCSKRAILKKRKLRYAMLNMQSGYILSYSHQFQAFSRGLLSERLGRVHGTAHMT